MRACAHTVSLSFCESRLGNHSISARRMSSWWTRYSTVLSTEPTPGHAPGVHPGGEATRPRSST